MAINPSGGVVLDLETRHVPEDDGPFFCAFIGSVQDPAGKLRRVTRLAATMDGDPSAYGDLEGVLTLGDRPAGGPSWRGHDERRLAQGAVFDVTRAGAS